MVVPENFTLPDESELTVNELTLSFPVLACAAFYVGKKCEWQNNEFLLCREETKDPRQCVKEGKDVTSCAMKVFQDLKKHCRAEFDQYVTCMVRSSGNLDPEKCRMTQGNLDKCVLDKLGIERPDYGYFCEAKVHDSPRPKPKSDFPVYEEQPKLKPEDSRPHTRLRAIFFN